MTYQKLIGNDPTIDDTNWAGHTYIDLINPAIAANVLAKVKAYCFGSTIVKIKIFRPSGLYYNFISEVSFNSSVGVNDVYMDIPIQSGDLIGYYSSSFGGIVYDHTVGDSVIKYGDIITNTLKSEWGSYAYTHKLGAGYDDAEYYVKTDGDDLKNGYSWTNGWKTINKAATSVADGTTVHIGFGTYDAEPAANKIAPQNVGSLGICYLPETATTGGGTGTVSVEQNP
jgi:hypothetical protein